MKLVTVCKRVN